MKRIRVLKVGIKNPCSDKTILREVLYRSYQNIYRLVVGAENSGKVLTRATSLRRRRRRRRCRVEIILISRRKIKIILIRRKRIQIILTRRKRRRIILIRRQKIKIILIRRKRIKIILIKKRNNNNKKK